MSRDPETPWDREQLDYLLAKTWAALGCPPEKSEELTMQLMRRARQLAEKTGRSEPEAVRHLMELVRRSYERRQTETS